MRYFDIVYIVNEHDLIDWGYYNKVDSGWFSVMQTKGTVENAPTEQTMILVF